MYPSRKPWQCTCRCSTEHRRPSTRRFTRTSMIRWSTSNASRVLNNWDDAYMQENVYSSLKDKARSWLGKPRSHESSHERTSTGDAHRRHHSANENPLYIAYCSCHKERRQLAIVRGLPVAEQCKKEGCLPAATHRWHVG